MTIVPSSSGAEAVGAPLQLLDVAAAAALEENQLLRAALHETARESAAKSRFLATMSHELRTPLTSILGFSQLLEAGAGGPLTDKQRRFVHHIDSSGRQLLSLISELLDLSKVAAGEMDLDIVEVDLAGVAEDTNDALRLLAGLRHQDVEVAVPAGIAVRADARRLGQALTNLLANAIKFTPEEGRITIGAQRAGRLVDLSVTDTGIGIAEEDQARVFKEFTQLEAGRRAGGTGLGLTLTRQLVEAMGGSVSVQSGLGEGSTFTIRLPAAPGPSVGCI